MSDWTPECTTHHGACECREMKHANEKIVLRNTILKMEKRINELTIRVDEEETNYVEMLDLRDREIRRNSKLCQALERIWAFTTDTGIMTIARDAVKQDKP